MKSLTKNPQPPTKKYFLKCRLQDLPRLLTLRLGLQHLPIGRNSSAKPRAFRCFFQKSPKAAGCQSFKNWHTPMNSHMSFSQILYFSLTPWESVYDIFVPGNRPKNNSCQLPYQHHHSSADCTRKLFKPSNDSTSLLVCNKKNFLVGGCRFFVGDVISEVVFRPFWLMLPGLGPNC